MKQLLPMRSSRARLAWVVLALGAASAGVQAQPVEVAGWVEKDPTTQAVPASAFHLARAGKTIAYPDAGLLACDKLTLVDDKAIVRVRLASNLRMQLDAESPGRQIQVPCDQRGIAADLAAAIRAMISGAEQRRVRVATVTREIAPLAIPALVAPTANIVAGGRALYIAWTGGVGPYSVQVLSAADGREVASQANIEGHSAKLAVTALTPGNYTLWVRNRVNHRVEGLREDGLVVVAEGSLPAMPAVLKDSALSNEARTLFYADFLAGQDDGRWTLEALQRVAALPARSAAVRQWLLRFGGQD